MCCRMAVTSYASRNILCKIHVTNEHAFLSTVWMLAGTFGPQWVKKKVTNHFFALCYWDNWMFLAFDWWTRYSLEFLLPIIVHSMSNTWKPLDFLFPLPQYCVNSVIKERQFWTEGHPCQCTKVFRLSRTFCVTPATSVSPSPNLFHFICFF